MHNNALGRHSLEQFEPNIFLRIYIHELLALLLCLLSSFEMLKIKLANEMNSYTNFVCVSVWKWWWLVGCSPRIFNTETKSFREKTATIPPLTLIIWYNFHFTRTDYKNKWKLLLIWIWCEQQQNQQFKFYAFQKNCEFRFKNKTQSNEWGKWNCR